MKKILLISAILISISSYSQRLVPNTAPTTETVNKIFSEVKTYAFKNASSVSEKTDLRLNRFSKSIQLNSMDIPLNEVKIRYAEMDGMHVLIFECNNCITTLENNREKELAGFGWPFKSRDSCFKMIDMLADLKDALNRN